MGRWRTSGARTTRRYLPRGRLLAAALVAVLVVAACGDESSEPATPDAPVEDVASVVAGNTHFALDLLRVVADEALANGEGPDVNLVLGPHSIATVLQTLEAGAKGTTATEFGQLFDRPTGDTSTWGAAGALDVALRQRSSGSTELQLANALFVQEGLPLNDEYRDTLTDIFAAELRPLDIGGDPSAARDVINDWVAGVTNDRIPSLLPPNTIQPTTRLVSVNATYLAAEWAEGFDPERTVSRPFVLLDGSQVDVPTMCRTTSELAMGGDPTDASVIALPYRGETLRMLVVLPHDLRRFLAELDGAQLDELRSNLAPEAQRLEFCLPRFEIRSPIELQPALAQLGLRQAFTDSADFSSITSAAILKLEFVQHEAWIRVDEEGTEAAAATAGGAGIISGPITIAVDRPFVFLIEDEPTGELLMAGIVADPSAVSPG